MKGKIKLISLFIVALFVLVPMISLFGQGSDFVDSDLVDNLLGTVEEFNDNSYSVEIVELQSPENTKSFYNQNAVYKLQTEVKVNDASDLEDGKYFTGIFIDEEGVFDLGNMFFREGEAEGYTPMIYADPEMNDKYQTFFGTTKGKQILIGVLSDTVPYFGNLYNNRFGKSKRARDRYIENVKAKLEDANAKVYVLEYNYNG